MSEMFADDSSLFSVVKNIDASGVDLKMMSKWTFQWKMNFNSGPA